MNSLIQQRGRNDGRDAVMMGGWAERATRAESGGGRYHRQMRAAAQTEGHAALRRDGDS